MSPLSGLKSLTYLELSFNQIGDVSPLAGLTNLTVLLLISNHVSDVSPHKGLTNLLALRLDINWISDMSPLDGLFALGVLYLSQSYWYGQTVTLPSVTVGTYPLPLKSLLIDPITSVTLVDSQSTATAMSVDLNAGTITFGAPGTYVATWTATMTNGFSGTFTITVVDGVPIYRIYNTGSGEHFYTSSAYEARVNVSSGVWIYEGIGWFAPSSGDPVYRLAAIPGSGSAGHLFTRNVKERDAALASRNPAGQPYWKCETGAGMPACVGWYSGGAVPLYRAFNPMPGPGQGQHNYTTDSNEQRVITGTGPLGGWKAEGIAWFGVKSGDRNAKLP